MYREEEEEEVWMMVLKKTSGRHGCARFSKQASLFTARLTQIPTRVNAICTAWTAWMEPFALFALLLIETTALFRWAFLIFNEKSIYIYIYIYGK
jgi:hypothetical protein